MFSLEIHFSPVHCRLYSDLCLSLSSQAPAPWKPFPLPPCSRNSPLLTQMMTSCCRNLSTSPWIHTSVTQGRLPTSVTRRLRQHIESCKHCPSEWAVCYYHGGCRRTESESPRSLLTLHTWGPRLPAPKSQANTLQRGLSLRGCQCKVQVIV